MTPLGIGGMLFLIFFLLLLVGCPIMVALGVGTMACFLILDIDLSMMIERAFASLTAFPLMALPAFVLAGALMEASGISHSAYAKWCHQRCPPSLSSLSRAFWLSFTAS